MKLQEALNVYLTALVGIRAASTVEWYRFMLMPLVDLWGSVDLRDLTLKHLREWRASLISSGAAIASVRGHLRALRAWLSWLVKEGLLENSPAARLEFPKEPRRPRAGIAAHDAYLMIEAAKSSPRDHAILLFVADTMCRAGGVVGLRWFDLDIEARQALVIEKGNKARRVYFGDQTAAALVRWQCACSSSEFVFHGIHGRPLTVNGLRQVYERIAQRAGVVREWHPHAWRHAGARTMLRAGANLAIVSQILGHADVNITVQHYGTLDDAELQRAHDLFSPLARS